MFPLDNRTTQRLAAAIVDIGGPYERPSYQVAQLLTDAGWSDVPDYDGSPRIPWLAEQMTVRRDVRADIERLLCRVCDPLEYDDGATTADEFRAVVNTILAPERLVVSDIGGRPVVGVRASDGRSAVFAAPEDLDDRLRRLIADPGAVQLLMHRVDETLLCERSGAHTMAIIGIGSFVEGLLYTLLTERDDEIRRSGFALENGKRVRAEGAGLELMINVAHAKDWIQLDAKDFMHNVRQYRNFVHPRLELEKRPRFDHDSVTLCWAPVRALLNDLERQVPPISTPAG